MRDSAAIILEAVFLKESLASNLENDAKIDWWKRMDRLEIC
jgi:hypothetical protein